MPSGQSSSPWVYAIASIVPLRPVSVTGFSGGSDALDSLGASGSVMTFAVTAVFYATVSEA